MSSLPIEQTWILMVDLLSDLTKKGYEVPHHVNTDLSLVRSQIGFYQRDPTAKEMMEEYMKAEMSLTEIQELLLNIGKQEGEAYVEKWESTLKRAAKGEEIKKIPTLGSHFHINTPPGFSSGRITLKKPVSEERLQEIAEYENLIIEFDDDLTISLYGDKENVQRGLREMAPFFMEE
jgi:hypothetical protein